MWRTVWSQTTRSHIFETKAETSQGNTKLISRPSKIQTKPFLNKFSIKNQWKSEIKSKNSSFGSIPFHVYLVLKKIVSFTDFLELILNKIFFSSHMFFQYTRKCIFVTKYFLWSLFFGISKIFRLLNLFFVCWQEILIFLGNCRVWS